MKTRISNTVEFLPAYGSLPTITPLDRFTMAIEDVVEAQRDPYFLKLAGEAGTPENIASRNIQAAWGVPQLPNEKPIQVPLPTSKSDPRTRSQTKSITERVYKPGTIIRKKFGTNWHEGEVRSYDPKSKFYRVNYQDGDIEDLEYHEIKPLVKGDQKYKAYTCRKAYSLLLKSRQEAR